MAQPNLNINHVALSVPDCEAASKWYIDLFGFRTLRPVSVASRTEYPHGLVFKIYGKELQSVRLSILTSGNGVGFEIFEFIDPEYFGPKTAPGWGPNTYARGGFFHVAITVPDPVASYEKAAKMGARIVGEVTEPAPGETCIYMEDPWGNVVELLSCSFENLIPLGSKA